MLLMSLIRLLVFRAKHANMIRLRTASGLKSASIYVIMSNRGPI